MDEQRESQGEKQERLYALAQEIVGRAEEREEQEGKLLPLPEIPGFSDDSEMNEIAADAVGTLKSTEVLNDQVKEVMSKFQLRGMEVIDELFAPFTDERNRAQVALTMWRARLLHHGGWFDDALEEVADFFREDTMYPEALYDMRTIASSWLDQWKEKKDE